MIRTFSEWISEPPRGIEELPSTTKTVPDMSLSVKDILTRFRRGTLDPESINRLYPDTDDDLDDDVMDGVEDMVDVFNLKNQMNGKVSEILRMGSKSAPVDSGESQEPSQVKDSQD